jgi:hypothetical protein
MFDNACNPTAATLSVPAYNHPPFFKNVVAWVDYFGVPVFVSQPFQVGIGPGRGYLGAVW